MRRTVRRARVCTYVPIGVTAAVALLMLSSGPAWAPPHGPPSPPKPPTGVSAVAGNGRAIVSWNPAEFSVYGYYPTGYVATALQRRTPVRSCATSTALTCTVTGLTNGQLYKVDVRTTYLGRHFVLDVSRPSLRVAVTPRR